MTRLKIGILFIAVVVINLLLAFGGYYLLSQEAIVLVQPLLDTTANHSAKSTVYPLVEREAGVAVILDTRTQSNQLLTTLKDWLMKLPLTWKVQFFHSSHNQAWVKEQFKKEIEEGRMILTPLLDLPKNLSKHNYSRVLTQPKFWRSIIHEHILMIQMDTAKCTPPAEPYGGPRNTLTLSDLVGFDYVGAPWTLPAKFQPPEWIGKVGNGGLSFRKRSTMIHILETLGEDPNPEGQYEDAYIVERLRRLMMEGANYTIADFETAKRFSVETTFYHSPWGVHAPWVRQFSAQQREILRANCPEIYKILRMFI